MLFGCSFDNTIDLTAERRFFGSSLLNLLGIHAFYKRFKIALGFDGISHLVVVVGNAHTQATDSVAGCATAVVAQNSFDLRWRDVICGLG